MILSFDRIKDGGFYLILWIQVPLRFRPLLAETDPMPKDGPLAAKFPQVKAPPWPARIEGRQAILHHTQ